MPYLIKKIDIKLFKVEFQWKTRVELYLKRNQSEAILQHSIRIRIGEPVMTVWAALLVNNAA